MIELRARLLTESDHPTKRVLPTNSATVIPFLARETNYGGLGFIVGTKELMRLAVFPIFQVGRLLDFEDLLLYNGSHQTQWISHDQIVARFVSLED